MRSAPGDGNVRVKPAVAECHIACRHKRRCGGVALGVGRDVLQKRLAGRLRIEQRIHGAGGVAACEFIERVEKPVVSRRDIRPLAPERRAGDGFIHRVGIYRAVRMSTFVPLAFFQAMMAQFSLAINSGAFCTLPPSATSSVVSAPFTRYVTV